MSLEAKFPTVKVIFILQDSKKELGNGVFNEAQLKALLASDTVEIMEKEFEIAGKVYGCDWPSNGFKVYLK